LLHSDSRRLGWGCRGFGRAPKAALGGAIRTPLQRVHTSGERRNIASNAMNAEERHEGQDQKGGE
jgi:hypothetical protein